MTMPRKPTHPGRVLKYDVIEALGLSVTEAAEKLGVTRKALSELLNEHAARKLAEHAGEARLVESRAERAEGPEARARRGMTTLRPFGVGCALHTIVREARWQVCSLRHSGVRCRPYEIDAAAGASTGWGATCESQVVCDARRQAWWCAVHTLRD